MRLLFLHGIWHPPAIYSEKIMLTLWSKLEENGFTICAPHSPRDHSTPVWPMIKERHPELTTHPEWYNAKDNDNGTKTLAGLPETIEFLRDYLNKEDTFDVVMGHSQGAQLLSILTVLAESDSSFIPAEKRWKLLVPMNGPNAFDTVDTLLDVVQKHGKIKTPSIHVFGGPEDVTWEGQQKMKNVHYQDSNSRIVRHNEGHMPPKDEAVCDELIKAMLDVLKTKNSDLLP